MTRLGRGFTLMELLVVLLIIGILSTVAIRTIDATRDRSLFDQTAAEMDQLVKAMTGDPSLVADGRRVDFGYFGDLGHLPDSLPQLVHSTDPRWHGPYLRVAAAGDTVGYQYDAWGNRYGYDRNTGTISSLGNGKYPMTVRVADSVLFLTHNSVSGNVLDISGNPPGDRAATMSVRFYTASGRTYVTAVDPGGYYHFPSLPSDTIFVGTHRMVAILGTSDSIVRWVTVVPRSNPVVDFRFGRPFRNQLVQVGSTGMSQDSTQFMFDVVNEGATDDSLSWMELANISGLDYDSVFAMKLAITGGEEAVQDSFSPGLGQGDTAYFTYTVGPNRSEVAHLVLGQFFKTEDYMAGVQQIEGRQFALRFSDGSEITVTTPQAP